MSTESESSSPATYEPKNEYNESNGGKKQNSKDPDEAHLKLLVVGDGAQGKTSLLISYTENRFPADYVPTVFDYSPEVGLVYKGKNIHLGLWDTVSREGYVWENSPHSWEIAGDYILSMSEKLGSNTPILLVATKIDLREDTKTIEIMKRRGLEIISPSQGKALAKRYNVPYVETSALTQAGLKQCFEQAISLALAKQANLLTGSSATGKQRRCVLY